MGSFKGSTTNLGETSTTNITVDGDVTLDDGGSIKEAGGTAAITIDGDGHVTKIGQDSPSNGEFLKYDGAKWVSDSVSSGGGADTGTANTFTEAQAISKDTDGEFVGLILKNESDANNTTGIVSVRFDLEDTGGTAVDSAKIAVKKEAAFTATAATQDSSIVFSTSLNGALTEYLTLNSAGRLALAGELSGSGDLNIAGAATLESTLNVSGAIATAVGVTGSTGVSGSYAHFNNISANDGGTKSIRINGDGTLVIAGGAADTTCLSASGDVNIVGKSFLENTLSVSGAIDTAVGITGSTGVSGSYAHFNNISANDGGTKSIRLNGDGTLVIAGGAADTTCLSASGDVNIVGKSFLENTLSVSGAISGAVGITGSSLQINDTITLNANGNITNAATVACANLTASAGISGSYGFVNNLGVNQGGTKSIQLAGDGTIVIAGGAADTTCLSASGDVNIVGKAYLENILNVSGVINSAAGMSASLGVSASVGNFNAVYINMAGTKDTIINGDGTALFGGKLTVLDEISGSGVLNIVGASTFESTMHVSGVINSAAGVSASLGVSASVGNFNALYINMAGTKDTIINGDGTALFGGKLTVLDEISGSGVLNIVGEAAFESTMGITGSVTLVGGAHGDIALDINAVNQAANVIDIAADALTSGDGINVASNSSDTTARSLLKLTNDHASATGTSMIELDQDSTGDLITAVYGANGTGLGLKIKEVLIDISASSTTTSTVSGFFPALGAPIALVLHVTTNIEGAKHITKIGTGAVDDLFGGSTPDGGAMNDGILDEDGDTIAIPIAAFAAPFSTVGGASTGLAGAQNLVLTHGSNPNAGAVRAVLYYWDITLPTS